MLILSARNVETGFLDDASLKHPVTVCHAEHRIILSFRTRVGNDRFSIHKALKIEWVFDFG